MRIIEAKHSGFCPGVRRAVDTVYRLLEQSPDAVIVTLGELIHNPQVVGELEERGVRSITDEDIPSLLSEYPMREIIVVIRAHGMTLEVEQMLAACGAQHPNLRVVDCTCPFVKNIHRIAQEESAPFADRPGEALGIIFGDPDHPEVKGIDSRFRCETRIFETAAETEAWCSTEEAQKFLKKRVIYVSQTTQKLAECKISQKFIEKLYTNAKIFDTICNVTENRQTETDRIAGEADLMLVIGGRGSSNTQKLYDICRQHCAQTYFIESPHDVPRHLLRPHMCAGITAGASTPDSIIQEVKKLMSEIEIMEENFAQMLDESCKT